MREWLTTGPNYRTPGLPGSDKYIYINFPGSPEPFAFGSQTGTLSRQTQLQDFTIPPLSVHALLTTKNLEGDISETIRAIRVPLVSKRIFNAVPTLREKKGFLMRQNPNKITVLKCWDCNPTLPGCYKYQVLEMCLNRFSFERLWCVLKSFSFDWLWQRCGSAIFPILCVLEQSSRKKNFWEWCRTPSAYLPLDITLHFSPHSNFLTFTFSLLLLSLLFFMIFCSLKIWIFFF